MDAKSKPRIVIEAVIIRKNGTIEDLGVISGDRKETLAKKILRWRNK